MTDQTESTSDAEFIEAIAAFGDLMRAFILNEPQPAPAPEPRRESAAMSDTKQAIRALELANDRVMAARDLMRRGRAVSDRATRRRLNEISVNLVWTLGELDSQKARLAEIMGDDPGVE